jgi:hypothetical protein
MSLFRNSETTPADETLAIVPPAEPIPDEAADASESLEVRLAMLELAPKSSQTWDEIKIILTQRREASQTRVDFVHRSLGKAILDAEDGRPESKVFLDQVTTLSNAAEKEVELIDLALSQLETERAAAVTRETAGQKAAQLERARELMREELADAVRLDRLYAQVNAVVAGMRARAKKFQPLSEVVKPVSFSRLNLRYDFEMGLYAACPALAEALGVGRDRPLPAMQTMTEQRAALFAHFGVSVPEVDTIGAVVVPPRPEDLINWDDRGVGQHGAEVLGQPLSTGGHEYQPNDTIAGEVVVGWKKANLKALVGSGRIRLLEAPAETAPNDAVSSAEPNLSEETAAAILGLREGATDAE